MKSNLYKSLLGAVIGASMFSLNSCTDLSETIYSELASEKYEFTDKDAAAMFAPVYYLCVMCIGNGMVMRM